MPCLPFQFCDHSAKKIVLLFFLTRVYSRKRGMHQVSKEIFIRVKKTINRVMFDLHKLPQFRPPSEKCTHVKRVHTLDDI